MVPGSLPVEVEASAAPDPVRLAVVRGVRVAGTVLGLEAGERVWVRVVGGDGTEWGGGPANADDPRFVVARVPVGEHRLVGEVEGGAASASVAFVVTPHDREVEVDLALERDDAPGLAVRGTVLVDGAPFSRLYLVLVPPDFGSLRATAESDAFGRFELCCVAPGRYDLMVGSRGSALGFLGPLDVESDLELPLELRRTEVRGRVVDAESGKPTAGATLTVLGPVEPASYHASSRVTGRDGRFRLYALVFEGSRLRVQARGRAGAELALRGGPLVDLGTVILPAGASAAGQPPP
jgi:hypothetical protein